MGHIATSLARVPKEDFEWFVLVLQDGWEDDLRSELSRNFKNLADEAGPETLAVCGTDSVEFYNEVAKAYALDTRRAPLLPYLLVTDTAPRDLVKADARPDCVRAIQLPLVERYVNHGSITSVLKDLAHTLRNKEGVEALVEGDKTKIGKCWGWLTKYFMVQPNFYGFGVNVDKILADLFARSRRRKA